MAQRVSQIVITALYGGATVRCRVSQSTLAVLYPTTALTKQRVSQVTIAAIYPTSNIRQRVTQNTLQVLRLIRTGWNYGCIVE